MEIANNHIRSIFIKSVLGESLSESEQEVLNVWKGQSAFHDEMVEQFRNQGWLNDKMRLIHKFPKDEVKQMILNKIALLDDSWMAINPFASDRLAPFKPLPKKPYPWTFTKVLGLIVIKAICVYVVVCRIYISRNMMQENIISKQPVRQVLPANYTPTTAGSDTAHIDQNRD